VVFENRIQPTSRPKRATAALAAAMLLAVAVTVAGIAAVAGLAIAMVQASEGIQNCYNKCDKVFDKTQYAISDQGNQTTFEYRSCLIGCDRCNKELANLLTVKDDTCFNYCKTFNYKKALIRKGVIEPDKACIIGCVINTCQEVCWGGTTDQDVTEANKNLWWGLGGNGCSLKMGMGYVQNPEYGNPDGGQGASKEQNQCCTNAFNLCYYDGDKIQNAINYANVELLAQRSCKKFTKKTDYDTICNWYNDVKNCGTQGMNPA